MALCLLKRAGLLVTVAPVVYVGFCACWTIGEVAYRYRNFAFGGDPDSAFGGDPVVKEEMSKLYDRVETKKNSSGSLSELINKKERAALLRRKFKYELRREVKKMANELEAEAALNIWKQNWRRSMIANFQRRLKYPISNEKNSGN